MGGGGRQHTILPEFSQKLHETERIWMPREGTGPSRPPPPLPGSANGILFYELIKRNAFITESKHEKYWRVVKKISISTLSY